ncbi:DUF6702 family protein [Yunchengibacter salinarum]|uniref:DUF6702 family protein n=1 Tax=Yunchengibacter salinarum TaxID=3133399 RepID=UPI0035B677E1
MPIRSYMGAVAVAAALFSALLATAAPARAHRSQTAFTVMQWSPDSGTWQIMHEVHLHDAQEVLDRIDGDRDLLVAEVEGRARLLLHVADRFKLARDGQALSLTPIGGEIMGDHLVLYQETDRLDGPGTRMSVQNDIFRDVFPDQVNQVNIERGTGVKTLRFVRAGNRQSTDVPKSTDLPGDAAPEKGTDKEKDQPHARHP